MAISRKRQVRERKFLNWQRRRTINSPNAIEAREREPKVKLFIYAPKGPVTPHVVHSSDTFERLFGAKA